MCARGVRARVRRPGARRDGGRIVDGRRRSWRFPRTRNRHRGSNETRGREVCVTHRIEDRHHTVSVPMQERLREVHGTPPADLDATPAPTAMASARMPNLPRRVGKRKSGKSFEVVRCRPSRARKRAAMASEPPKRWPRVGVGVLIVKEGKVLIGKRKGSHGAGQYALPGGKLEWRETWADCARREVLEETAISLYDVPVTYCYTTEAVIDDDNHWITVFMVAEVASNVEASNEEPEKCEGWEWMRWDEVPTPRFKPLDNILGDAGFALPGAKPTNGTTGASDAAPRPGIPEEHERVCS